MSSSYMSWRSSATNRRPTQPTDNPKNPGHIHPDLDPAPISKPVVHLLALGLIIFLGLLQCLPASHFRDPSDHFRNWVKETPVCSGPMMKRRGWYLLFHGWNVWTLKCWQFLPTQLFEVQGNEDKVSFYKLKVLFPHSNLELHGQEEVKEIIRTATSETEYGSLNFEEIAPFIIPSVHKSLRKFIYVSPNLILKGRVEELTGIYLSTHAVAAAEDCSKRLNSYVNSDVLDAIQRSASKSWVSVTPYLKDACMPDLNLLLIYVRKLEKEFLEAILWWSKVLNWSDRSSKENPAIVLALYNRYVKLSNFWLVKEPASPEIIEKSMVIHYDGPRLFALNLEMTLFHGHLMEIYG